MECLLEIYGPRCSSLVQPLHPDVGVAVAVAGDGHLPGIAAHLAVLDHRAPGVGLDRDLDPLAAPRALHLDDVVPVAVAAHGFFVWLFGFFWPSFFTISNSSLVTGCTDRREPFWVTTIFSSPGVSLSVAS